MDSSRDTQGGDHKKAKIDREQQEEGQIHDENDSDDSSSIGVPLIVSPTDVQAQEKIEKPPDGLEWKDDAIENCLQIAIEGFDSSRQIEWRIPSLVNSEDDKFLANWSPISLPLPVWAVDPFSRPT